MQGIKCFNLKEGDIIRVFIAIEFDEVLKEELYKIQQLVKEQSIKGNFTLKDNFHLTLKFIGEVSLEEVEQLKKVIDTVTKNKKQFDLILSSIGKFPRGNKSIVWLGIEKNLSLTNLYQEIEDFLNKEGYTKEKREFTPHITLGREVILKNQLRVNFKPLKFTVKRISLMESTRIKGKLTYIPLYSKELE